MVVEISIIEKRTPQQSPVDEIVNKASQAIYNKTGINSKVFHYNLSNRQQEDVDGILNRFSITQIPAVVIQQEGDPTIRRRLQGGDRINYANIYRAINYNEVGDGTEDAIPAKGGSSGVIPLLSIENLPNVLKSLLGNKNIKTGVVIVAILLIINANKE